MLMCGLACATESFEKCPTGAVKELKTEYGALTAAPGHAEVLGKLARTGKKTLHIMGGKQRSVLLSFAQPLKEESVLSFWMERWTKAAPFNFRLMALTPQGEVELVQLKDMAVKGYTKQASSSAPAKGLKSNLKATSWHSRQH